MKAVCADASLEFEVRTDWQLDEGLLVVQRGTKGEGKLFGFGLLVDSKSS